MTSAARSNENPLNLLAGTRVLDITTTLAGPYATQLLGDFGADVIKIEPPTGDPVRDAGPREHSDMGVLFMVSNRNKRSVTLDLRSPEGRAAVKALADTADVVVHNMRMGAAERCGIDASTLRDGHPELIHCVVRGFGEGPYGDLAAYDDVIQCASGMAAQQAWVGGFPQYAASGVADKIAALAAAFVVSTALFRRSQTGDGASIEVPMFEMVTAFAMVEHLYGKAFVPPKGEARYPRQGTPMRRPFKTSDGHIGAVVYTNDHWQKFFAMIGRPELADDARFATLQARTEHLDDVLKVVEDTLASATTAEWAERLAAAGIPARPYVTVDDLFDDEHLKAVDFFHRVTHPSEGEMVVIPTPIKVDGVRPGAGSAAPRLGADTDAVLAELGIALPRR
ncbi:MAG: CaiB/BaiF CoA transferase family protein [Acidimicrobiia bacterium]